MFLIVRLISLIGTNTRIYLNHVPSKYKMFHEELLKPEVCHEWFLFRRCTSRINEMEYFHFPRKTGTDEYVVPS